MLNPYLFYQDTCEAAFNYYAKVLGGKIDAMMRSSDAPPDMAAAPGREKTIMHARMSLPDGSVLMASDAPSEHFHKPQGFSDLAHGRGPGGGRAQVQRARRWGQRHHALQQDVLGQGFWHVRRQVRHSLDGELPGRGNVTGAIA
ncbi:PhnB protein [Bradyrhizobium sp. GM0.4]